MRIYTPQKNCTLPVGGVPVKWRGRSGYTLTACNHEGAHLLRRGVISIVPKEQILLEIVKPPEGMVIGVSMLEQREADSCEWIDKSERWQEWPYWTLYRWQLLKL